MKPFTKNTLPLCLLLTIIVSGTMAESQSPAPKGIFSLTVTDAEEGEIGSLGILKIREEEYILLEELPKLFGGARKYEPLTGRATVTIMGKRIILTIGHRQLKVDNEEYALSAPPISTSGKIAVPVEFLSRILPHVLGKKVSLDLKKGILQIEQKEDEQEIGSSNPSRSTPAEFRVIIDPGHGGYDTGAKTETELLEKDLTLSVAFQTRNMLLEKEGIDVYLTREEDRYMASEERVNFANNLRGNIFFSIHFNWSPSRNLRGFSIYVNSNRINSGSDFDTPLRIESKMGEEFLPQSKRLAEEIKDRLEDIGLKGEKIKEVPLAVMDGLFMPGVLVEILYLSNSEDLEILSGSDFIKSVSKALCDSILAFKSATAELKH